MEYSSLWLVIPTGKRHEYLSEIFLNSGLDPEKIILVRTMLGDNIPGAINVWSIDELNIHKWWNVGIRYAMERGARYVAVLNDDTALKFGDLKLLFEKQVKEGTTLGVPVRRGAAGWGHCWILDTSHGVLPDERFFWWCGDHDLEIQAQKIHGVTYQPLDIINRHPNELTLSSQHLIALTKKDIRSFRKKYPFRAIREFWHWGSLRFQHKIKSIFNSS